MEHSSPPPPSPVPPPPIASDSGQLPRRVEQVDPNATQVTPAAYQQRASDRSTLNRPRPGGPPPGGQPPRNNYPSSAGGGYPPPPPTYSRSVGVPARGAPASRSVPTGRRKTSWRRGLGCALRGLVALLFVVVFVVVGAGSWLVFQYFAIAQELPPVDQLRDRAAQFETTRIFDRNGNVLYEILDPNAGRRTIVPLAKISPNFNRRYNCNRRPRVLQPPRLRPGGDRARFLPELHHRRGGLGRIDHHAAAGAHAAADG